MEFDFSQNGRVADINKIPNDFRGLYKQDGDNYVLDAEDAKVKSAVSAITGLNTALKAARAEAKNRPAGVDLTLLKDYGATPEEIHAKIKETVEGLQGQIKGVNLDKIKQDLATEYSGKLTGAETKVKGLEGQLYSELVESRATAAIKEAGGDVELLLPFVGKQIKAASTPDGKYTVQVVDGAGDVRYSGVTGAPMAIKELVQEMKSKETFGKLFASEAPAGGGSAAGAAGRKQGTASSQTPTGELTATQKISKGLAAMRRK